MTLPTREAHPLKRECVDDIGKYKPGTLKSCVSFEPAQAGDALISSPNTAVLTLGTTLLSGTD